MEPRARIREAGEKASGELDRLASLLDEEARPVAEGWTRSVLRAAAEVGRRLTGRGAGPWLLYPSVRGVFRSDAELANLLGVSRSRIARWKRGEAADLANEARLRDLAVVVLLLSDYLEEPAIRDWLLGTNPQLAHERPVDLVMLGRLSEVVRALEAEKAGAFA